MEKYGFVYIWYDRKHSRYYIGCHWGTEDDGYICSSSWMKKAYKYRPQDFRRRIITKVYTNKNDLLIEEYKWLQLIPEEQLGKMYYNLRNGYQAHWSSDPTYNKSISEKISKSVKKALSKPEIREKIKLANSGRIHTEATKSKMRETHARINFKHSDITKDKIRKANIGKTMPPEVKEKLLAANLGKKHNPRTEEHKRKLSESNTGKVRSEETKRRLSEAKSGKKRQYNDDGSYCYS